MKASFRIARVAGIDIGVHYTWLFAFVLIAWSLARGFFPDIYPGWEPRTYWVAGVIAAILLFVSVLLHELAHSLVARRFGYPVESITLFIFGGVSQIRGEADKPRHEFLIAAVGPGSSLLIALILWFVAGRPDLLLMFQEGSRASATPVWNAVVAYLAFVNLLPGIRLNTPRNK